MKILVVEDDLSSRKFIQKFLSSYGQCDVTIDGIEAIEAFNIALDSKEPYDLICLDVMLPKIDGIRALKAMRELERIKGIDAEKRAKVIVTSALANTGFIRDSFKEDFEAYIGKPIDMEKMRKTIKDLGLI